ncbi:MAG: hypothetical protein AB1611_09275 [bacterium]
MKLNQVFGPSTPITITLAGLASGQARSSLAVDNDSNRYIDAMVTLGIALASGTPAGDKQVLVWFYGSEDGLLYGDNATGADQAIVKRDPSNWRGPFELNTPDGGGLTYIAMIPSVAAYFNKVLPRKWGIIIENQSGLALGGAEENFTKAYTGISLQFETVEKTLHNAATVVDATGVDTDVTAYATANLQISGTSTNFRLEFYGSVDGSNFSPISGVNLQSSLLASTANALNQIWQFDTSALKTLRIKLASIANGNVTTKLMTIP